MSFNLTSSYAIKVKAGANANATATASNTILAKFCDQAESTLSTLTRYDWVTNSASITAKFLGVLDDTVSSLAAMQVITYDMSGYTSRREAETMLDVLTDGVKRNIDKLNEDAYKEIMGSIT